MDKAIEVPDGWSEEKYGWTILYFDDSGDLRYVYASESERVGDRHEAVLYRTSDDSRAIDDSVVFYRGNSHREAEEVLQEELNKHHSVH